MLDVSLLFVGLSLLCSRSPSLSRDTHALSSSPVTLIITKLNLSQSRSVRKVQIKKIFIKKREEESQWQYLHIQSEQGHSLGLSPSTQIGMLCHSR